MEKKQTELYKRNLVKPYSVRDREITEKLLAGATMGIGDLGVMYLGRDFHPKDMPKTFPNPENCVSDGELMIDAYRTALHEFYSLNPNQEIFTLDLVPWILRTDSGKIVRASSIQYVDLNDNFRLMDKDHAAVILSRNSPLDINKKNAKAIGYLLGWHELGHLAFGDQICKDENCIHSHPPETDRERALEEKAQKIIQDGYSPESIPVCNDCRKRLMDFRGRHR